MKADREGGASRAWWDEVVSEDGKGRDELLQSRPRSKSLHRPLSFSDGNMGIFRPIVQTLVGAMFDGRHDRAPSRGVGAEFVGYDPLWWTPVLAQKPCQQSQCSRGVAVDLHDFVEHVSLLINGAPEIALLAIDGDDESSGPGEFHPQALTDPDVSVSAHPALTIRPLPDTAIANVRTALAPDALRPGPSAAHADHALSGVDISTSPSVPGVDRDALALGKVPICDNGHSS
jgi:hypothetical protein